jgi:hypothetical protein
MLLPCREKEGMRWTGDRVDYRRPPEGIRVTWTERQAGMSKRKEEQSQGNLKE